MVAGLNGVTAPAKSVVSTVPANANYYTTNVFDCSDRLPGDNSGIAGDGFGTCTGTSMASPHVSALAGILRSVNPRLSKDVIKAQIRYSGSNSGFPNGTIGYGMPNALTAVNNVLSLTTPSRLTPLFSFYSATRLDYFYTTAPQMATAALYGTLASRRASPPVNHDVYSARYVNVGDKPISGYSAFPGGQPPSWFGPGADAWVFTTPANPKNAGIPLVPLYRLSWKCGDNTPYPPALCASYPEHIDVAYTADPSGVTAFQSLGYKLDGIEGYIYPKTIPQPPGSQRLMRKYSPTRDDHAIFPENRLASMASQGYTQNSGSDWLGYVYPNLTGAVPTIQ